MINNGKNKGKGIGLVMRSRILSSLLVLGCAVPVAAPVLQPLSVYAEETAGTPSETDPAAPAEDQAATTEITVQVVFAGTETFPEKITLNLLANNVVCNTVEVTAETQWAFTFKNLPVTDEAGAPIVYTVDEVEPAGFVKTIDGTTITNTWSEQKAAEDAAAAKKAEEDAAAAKKAEEDTAAAKKAEEDVAAAKKAEEDAAAAKKAEEDKTLPPPRRLRKTPLPPRRLRKTPPLPRRLRKTLPPQRRLRKTPPLPRRLRKTLPLPRRLQKMHRKLPQMLLPRKKPQKTLLQRRLQKTQKRSKRQMLLQRRLQTRLPLQRKKRKKPKRSPKMPGKLLKKPSWRLKKQGSLPRRPVMMPIN